MNYEDLKAAELKALCEERHIKPSRAKADMIADLKALDAANELTQLTEELGLYEDQTPSETVPAPEPQEEPENAPDEPVWLSDGRLYKRYTRHGILDNREHEGNLTDVIEEAVIRGLEPLPPSYRVGDPDSKSWVYAVNVR